MFRKVCCKYTCTFDFSLVAIHPQACCTFLSVQEHFCHCASSHLPTCSEAPVCFCHARFDHHLLSSWSPTGSTHSELMVSFQHPAENNDFAWIWANFHLELEQKWYQVAAYSIPDSTRKKAMCLAALTMSGDESSKWRQKPDDP